MLSFPYAFRFQVGFTTQRFMLNLAASRGNGTTELHGAFQPNIGYRYDQSLVRHNIDGTIFHDIRVDDNLVVFRHVAKPADIPPVPVLLPLQPVPRSAAATGSNHRVTACPSGYQ